MCFKLCFHHPVREFYKIYLSCHREYGDTDTSMDKAETMSEKLARLQKEAEIPKTAPKPSPKAGEKPAKTWQKVAEITINLKTVKKIRLLLKRIDSLVG